MINQHQINIHGFELKTKALLYHWTSSLARNLVKDSLTTIDNNERYVTYIKTNSLLTQQVDLEGASCTVSSRVIGNISDVVGSPQQCLAGPVSAALLYASNADVVTELRLVPRHDCCAVLGYHPQISRAVLHLWWNLSINSIVNTC